MTTDPVVAVLAKLSGARLRQMQSEIRQQEESLHAQGLLIERALDEKGQDRAGQAPANGKGARRQLFKEILASQPGREWKPAEIRNALAERGVEAKDPAIRVMLRRMADAEEVERGENGWRLASQNGSQEEPLIEATSGGPGGV